MENSTLDEKTSPKNSLLNRLVKIVLPILLGVVILYFLFRDTDFSELWSILQKANWGILAFSLLFGLLGNTIRGYRWQLIINPLGYTPKVSTLNYAIYGGYAVNFALPRAGEVWRCGIVAKEENIPFVKLFGTMILDRILDTLTVLMLVLVAFLFNMEFFISELGNNPSFGSIAKLLQSPWLYIASVVAITFVIAIFKFFGKNPLIKKVKDFAVGMKNDLKAIWRMKTKNRLFLYTIGIWGSYFLYFYITFFAFGFTSDLGIVAGLTAFALSSLSMGVPTNGGMGAWHFAVVAALSLYGIDRTQSMAFATGVFTLQSLWVIICGLGGLAALAIRKQK